MELESVTISLPENSNVIIGHSHFIKTVEDIAEILVNTVPQGKYGLAFNESSGPCLVRAEGNDEELKKKAIENALKIGAGHVFVLLLRDCFPINVLGRVKECFEVCNIYCATANPVEVIVALSEQGRGVLGVIDGSRPKGVEGPDDVRARKEFLRKIGYKF